MITFDVAGWSSLAARRAHNPKVAGSNPAPATNLEAINVSKKENKNSLENGRQSPFFVFVIAV